ncbi:hypothetical protein TNCV_2396251 [Trichonephila clavipes]|uniref:Uncharacterized protein n=1 Tax=Trichonephila clavipes TaxID=2585209 RepID=A0A8X6T1W1_TRICX|nr:hypothetical protein TNCV_2396251 [Trichonephila clavipes]
MKTSRVNPCGKHPLLHEMRHQCEFCEIAHYRPEKCSLGLKNRDKPRIGFQDFIPMALLFTSKFFFQTQPQGHEKTEEPLLAYVIVRALSTPPGGAGPVQMLMLSGDIS